MAKKTFFLKLNPPRASFTMDMSDKERSIIVRYIVYWNPYIQRKSFLKEIIADSNLVKKYEESDPHMISY